MSIRMCHTTRQDNLHSLPAASNWLCMFVRASLWTAPCSSSEPGTVLAQRRPCYSPFHSNVLPVLGLKEKSWVLKSLWKKLTMQLKGGALCGWGCEYPLRHSTFSDFFLWHFGGHTSSQVKVRDSWGSPMPASSVTSFSPIGSPTKLRCFWLVLDILILCHHSMKYFSHSSQTPSFWNSRSLTSLCGKVTYKMARILNSVLSGGSPSGVEVSCF